MPIGEKWGVAEIRSDQGVEIVRFCVDHSAVLTSSNYKRSIWVNVFSGEGSDLDGMLDNLNRLEDAVTAELEQPSECLLLLTISDACSKTLVFAVGGGAEDLEDKIARVLGVGNGSVDVRVFDARKFGPYGSLIKRTSK